MFITHEVFTASALAVAMAGFLGQDKASIAAELADTHSRTYSDEGLSNELTSAAEAIVKALSALFASSKPGNREMAIACETLYKAIDKFDEKGNKRSRLFRGAWFNRLSQPLSNKVDQSVRYVILYYSLISTGKIKVESL